LVIFTELQVPQPKTTIYTFLLLQTFNICSACC